MSNKIVQKSAASERYENFAVQLIQITPNGMEIRLHSGNTLILIKLPFASPVFTYFKEMMDKESTLPVRVLKS